MTSTKNDAISNMLRNAGKLITRANALGIVSKNGLVLTSQQGEELLAAAAGYRNRHVYRDALNKAQAGPNQPEKLDIRAVMEEWSALLDEQGWTPVSMNMILKDFILEKQMMPELLAYAKSRVVGDDTASSDGALIKLNESQLEIVLEKAGYSVVELDGAFYWEDLMEASEDFVTHMEAARAAAFEISVSYGITRANLEAMDADAQFQALGGITATAESLEDFWGSEHPYFTREDWQDDVACGDTKEGYWQWVLVQIESDCGCDVTCKGCGKRAYNIGGGQPVKGVFLNYCESCSDTLLTQ